MPEPDVKPLNQREIGQLADALEKWAETHPEPDTKVLAFGLLNPSLSPRQLARAIHDHARYEPSVSSEHFLRLVQYGREELDLESLIGWLHGAPPVSSQN